MSVLIQISDTHFGTQRTAVVDALLQFVSDSRPEIVVISGDITQRARRRQFKAARRFRDQLRAPAVMTLPGNHDIPLFNLPARLLFPYANYQREFGKELEPQYDSGAFMIVGVNTTRPHRHIDGEVSTAQITRVAHRLHDATAEQIRIVVTHQPVHVIRQSDEKNLLHGHEAAVRGWTQAGADLIMGGHIHLPYVRPLSDRFPDLPRRSWAVQAGTAVSHRVRHGTPNSINVVRRLSTAQFACAVERWDYDADTMHFALVHTDRLELDRRS